MATNLEKFKSDLNGLINGGVDLQMSMYAEQKMLSDDQQKKYTGKIVSFSAEYQGWYSEAREVVAQLIPNRLDDFTYLYKSKEKRKSPDYENYTVYDYLMGLTTTRGLDTVVEPKAGIPKFQQQLLILKSAQRRFTSSLFDIKQLLQADLFDSEIDSARHLIKNGFARAAGAMAGLVIEAHLQQVCLNHNVKVTKKKPSINNLADLLKDASVIEVPEWRNLQHLADLRNLCDHKKAKDPSDEQINSLLDGTDKLIKTLN